MSTDDILNQSET